MNNQETLREFASLANSDLTETLRMEFSELKAEAYCSLGWVLNLWVSYWREIMIFS